MPREIDLRARRLLAQVGIRLFIYDLYVCKFGQAAGKGVLAANLSSLIELYAAIEDRNPFGLSLLCDQIESILRADIKGSIAITSVQLEDLPYLSRARAEDHQGPVKDAFAGTALRISQLLGDQSPDMPSQPDQSVDLEDDQLWDEGEDEQLWTDDDWIRYHQETDPDSQP